MYITENTVVARSDSYVGGTLAVSCFVFNQVEVCLAYSSRTLLLPMPMPLQMQMQMPPVAVLASAVDAAAARELPLPAARAADARPLAPSRASLARHLLRRTSAPRAAYAPTAAAPTSRALIRAAHLPLPALLAAAAAQCMRRHGIVVRTVLLPLSVCSSRSSCCSRKCSRCSARSRCVCSASERCSRFSPRIWCAARMRPSAGRIEPGQGLAPTELN